MNKWCQNCTWWSFTYQDSEKKFGTCENPIVQDSLRMVQEECVTEMCVFTESCFGCVWFETEDHNTITEIPNPLDED